MFYGKEMEWFKKCDGVVKVLDLFGWQAFSFGVRDLVWNSQRTLKKLLQKIFTLQMSFFKGYQMKIEDL